MLVSEITQKFRKGIQITQNMIHYIVITYYETPWIVAEKAPFQEFIKNRKQIYQSDRESYTQEFLDLLKISNLGLLI